MLMEIDPLSMRGSLVMTMAMISPSRRDVSPAEQLRRSPRLVLPRFRLETAALHPEIFLMIFSRAKDTLYQKMGIRGLAGGPRGTGVPRGVGRALHPRGQEVAPSGAFFAQYFYYIPKPTFVEFQDFWSCAEQVSNICSFSSPEFQLSAFSLFV